MAKKTITQHVCDIRCLRCGEELSGFFVTFTFDDLKCSLRKGEKLVCSECGTEMTVEDVTDDANVMLSMEIDIQELKAAMRKAFGTKIQESETTSSAAGPDEDVYVKCEEQVDKGRLSQLDEIEKTQSHVKKLDDLLMRAIKMIDECSDDIRGSDDWLKEAFDALCDLDKANLSERQKGGEECLTN